MSDYKKVAWNILLGDRDMIVLGDHHRYLRAELSIYTITDMIKELLNNIGELIKNKSCRVCKHGGEYTDCPWMTREKCMEDGDGKLFKPKREIENLIEFVENWLSEVREYVPRGAEKTTEENR